MCAPLGVDPLSSTKGLFTGLLGIGQFYYELSVKVAEVCISTRSRNGGIISVEEVRQILKNRGTRFNFSKQQNRNKQQENKTEFNCSEDDIITAVKKLSKLGSGFRTEEVGKSVIIISVPIELNKDHMEVMQIASHSDDVTYSSQFGSVTIKDVITLKKWDKPRASRAMKLLLEEGMAWIDRNKFGEEVYWFPSLWKEALVAIEEQPS